MHDFKQKLSDSQDKQKLVAFSTQLIQNKYDDAVSTIKMNYDIILQKFRDYKHVANSESMVQETVEGVHLRLEQDLEKFTVKFMELIGGKEQFKLYTYQYIKDYLLI